MTHSIFSLPLEIRQEIYRLFFLISSRKPHSDPTFPLIYAAAYLQQPNQDSIIVLANNSIRETSKSHLCHENTIDGVSSLLRTSHDVQIEAQEVLYKRFMFSFTVAQNVMRTYRFLEDLSSSAMGQIRHLGFVIRLCDELDNAEGCYTMHDIYEWKVGNDMLVDYLPNLRSASFELQIMISQPPYNLYAPMPSPLPVPGAYESLVDKCLAVARPFSNVPGLKMHWKGQHLGAHVALLCSERFSALMERPWSTVDMSLDALLQIRYHRPMPGAGSASIHDMRLDLETKMHHARMLACLMN